MPLVSAIIDDAQVLLNDVVADVFTDALLLPVVGLAYQDLQDEFALNGLQDVEEYDYTANVAANAISLSPPADLITPITVWEKNQGEGDDRYTLVIERSWEPDWIRGVNLSRWQWQENEIRFPGATQAKTVKVTYVKFLTAIVDGNTNIPILNSRRYLASRTAAIAAFCIGGNAERSEVYQADAERRLKILIGFSVKRNQGQGERRKPFRAQK